MDDRELFDALWWGLGTFLVCILVIIGGLFLSTRVWPPDTYVRSEYRPAVVTSIDDTYYCEVSFSVDGQPYPQVSMGKLCSLKIKRGHRWIATVDVLRTSKGRVYGAINWASLRREFLL